MIHPNQLRSIIIEPTLKQMEMYSPAAVELLMLTCATESQMGHFLKQHPTGPALGIFQMEGNTYRDIWKNYLKYNDDLAVFMAHQFHATPDEPWVLTYDLRVATAMCRLHYRRVKEALPAADDVEGLASYWKEYYNTPNGAGKPAMAVRHYAKYVQAFM